ncbi:MAG TPA: phospho-N-acetylmuramoyl-pentapeptide-transferase [Verrucomicrobiota bacterium]|nr:phospho-N-acetylmuramoyl-pentapeptide-transferase [Verrucomicrobiota bacterium]HNT14228.1 phospho-N-acetylmuramoyl-pentapeptide-transferase [Verrucomicrobiota bacterium]
MLFYLSQAIMTWAEGSDHAASVSFLRLFRYITFRSAGAAVTALLLSWWLGPKVIARLKQLKFGQEYKDLADQSGAFETRVLSKKGTPTMGGILIVLVLNLTAILWAQMNPLLELTLLTVLVLAGLGFYDDYAKILKQQGGGAPPRVKLWVQFAVAAFVAVYLWQLPQDSWLRFTETQAPERHNLVSTLMLPFYKFPIPCGAAVGLLIVTLTIVGSSNAVNLTDGLDGLAVGCTIITATVFLVLTYLASNFKYATYLQIPYVEGAGELTIFCAALIGAGMGFLWFNCHPAQIFMGDTGSLALGGALGLVAVLIHQPVLLVIAGGVFVMEAGSVIVQKGWFKFTRKCHGVGQRVFLMAPIHHHFEKKGWYESQVVTRFYILCVLFAVVALSTLKIR